MMDLDSGLAKPFFKNMIKTRNFVIIETITLSSFCPFMNLFMHLGFDIHDIRTYCINLAIYNNSDNTMIIIINVCVRHISDGFMKCLKLPNKKMCDICNHKHVLDNVRTVTIICVLNVSRTITKTMLIHVLIVDLMLQSTVK